MDIVCTYCSAGKDPGTGLIPAFKRYISQRIVRIQEIADDTSCQLFILSGEFGLISQNQPIPYYDHLLEISEVPDLTKKVRSQIEQNNITSINYYTKPPSQDENLIPYVATIQNACDEAGVKLNLYYLENINNNPSPNNWKEITERAAEAKLTLIKNRKSGEACFDKLIQLYPFDGMIFFQRGGGYEAIRENELAIIDYEKAKSFFPIERWKWEAQEAINNLRNKTSIDNTLTESIVKVKKLKHLDQSIISSTISAIALIYVKPTSAAVEFRNVLGEILKELTNKNTHMGNDLISQINSLKSFIPEIMVNHMNTIRLIGNQGAHSTIQTNKLTSSDIYPSCMALIAILEWMESNTFKKD